MYQRRRRISPKLVHRVFIGRIGQRSRRLSQTLHHIKSHTRLLIEPFWPLPGHQRLDLGFGQARLSSRDVFVRV